MRESQPRHDSGGARPVVSGGAFEEPALALKETIRTALSRLFLDSELLIEEAASLWRSLSAYRSARTSIGRRELAFILWETLANQGIIREKEDIEHVCQVAEGGVSRAEKLYGRSPRYRPPSSCVDVLGAWMGVPFRRRRDVARYMRTFESENKHLKQSPELLAAASLLYVCNLRKKKGGSPTPDYLKGVLPSTVSGLVGVERGVLRSVYDSLPREPRRRRRFKEAREGDLG